MDHNNLIFDNFTTERVLRWRLILEEYGTEIKYIKGPDNNAADALISLPLINSDVEESKITREQLDESYGAEKLDGDTFSLTYRAIHKYQRKDKNLVEILKCANFCTKYFRGGGNTFMLICKSYIFFVPKILQKYVVN